MKKKYIKPDCEIIVYTDDVLIVSGEEQPTTSGEWLPGYFD